MSARAGGKLLHYINWRIRVVLSDTRTLIGTFLAFDKHLNVVLSDTVEFRIVKKKAKKKDKSSAAAAEADSDEKKENGKDENSMDEEKKVDGKESATAANSEVREQTRTLGLVILRGETVVSISPESPPPLKPKSESLQKSSNQPPAGIAAAVGRGMAPPPMATQSVPGLGGAVRGMGAPSAATMMPIGYAGRAMPPPAVSAPLPTAAALPTGAPPSGMPPTGVPPPPGAYMQQHPAVPPMPYGPGGAAPYPYGGGAYGRGAPMPNYPYPPPHAAYGRGLPPPPGAVGYPYPPPGAPQMPMPPPPGAPTGQLPRAP